MRKMIWFTVVSIIVMVFAVPVILALGLTMVPLNTQPGYDPNIRVSIYRDRIFVQKFTSNTASLTALGLSIRNPNLKNKTSIILNLQDLEGNIVRSVAISGMNLEDGSFTKFIFEPIPDSFGKEYLFTISSPGAGPEETIEVFIIDPEESSGITEYSYMGETYSGGTPIVVYKSPENKLSVVKSIYSNWLSRLILGRSQKSL